MRRAARFVAGATALLVGLVAGAIGVLAATTPRPSPSAGWTRRADMPVPRGETAVTVRDRLGECPGASCTPTEHVVVAGGIAGLGRTVADVGLYFPRADVWTPGPPLPEPRDHAAAAALDGAVFVAGGSNGVAGPAEPTFWVMREDARGWDVLAPMPEGRWGHAMVQAHGRLYVVGGRGGTDRLLIYDPALGWTHAAALPGNRDHLAAVVVDGRIWAVGGRVGFGVVGRVDVYDPVLDRWSPGPALPVPMSAMAAGLVGGGVHVVGGERPSFAGGVIDRHLRLDLGTFAWTEQPRPIVAVHGVGGGVVDGRLYVAGGSRRQGALSVLGWTGVTQSFAPRRQRDR